MIRIRSALSRRFSSLKRNPRHFAQLLLPAALLLLGCVAFLLGWRAFSLILISLAVLTLAALIWFRLRRIQARVDASQGRTAALMSQVRALSDSVAQVRALVSVPAPEAPRGLDVSDLVPALALASGVPSGLAGALQDLASVPGRGLVVVPDALIGPGSAWVQGMTPGGWDVVGESGDSQRALAAASSRVIIVDGHGLPDFSGVLGREFFWWLPKGGSLVLVADDVIAFAGRLGRSHDVELLVEAGARGRARAIITRGRK